ncbi:flagellar protein FlaG [Shouchella patagoniensis]|uniref:flagellar protein FlaG n=1 Tax=Shouchella patagoniensis TaxID=228576 RepID=UPI000994EC1B|nr:flagellar protein FlaG [Shouchella patagoniensis]
MSLQIPLSIPFSEIGLARYHQQVTTASKPSYNGAVGGDIQTLLDISSDHVDKVTKRALAFNIHKDLDRVYVQVIDQETQEVLREVPPEKILDLIASMMKSVGLIVDHHV